MIGMGFILRVLQLGFYLLVAVLLIIFISWCVRAAWTLFDANFKEQAAWVRGLLPKRKKRRKK